MASLEASLEALHLSGQQGELCWYVSCTRAPPAGYSCSISFQTTPAVIQSEHAGMSTANRNGQAAGSNTNCNYPDAKGDQPFRTMSDVSSKGRSCAPASVGQSYAACMCRRRLWYGCTCQRPYHSATCRSADALTLECHALAFVCIVADLLHRTPSLTRDKVMLPLDAAWAKISSHEHEAMKKEPGGSFAT